MANKPKFRSKFEASIWNAVPKRTGRLAYEDTAVFYNDNQYRRYTPDFTIIIADKRIYVEAKGRLTGFDRRKMLLVKEQHPDLDIRFVFMRSKNTLTKRSKTTYAEWATKHRFQWAEKTIPEDWLEE